MADPFISGTKLGLEFTLRDENGDPIDGNVKGELIEPNGTIVIFTNQIVRVSQGFYAYDFTPYSIGTWRYRLASDGPVKAAFENFFNVESSFVGSTVT